MCKSRESRRLPGTESKRWSTAHLSKSTGPPTPCYQRRPGPTQPRQRAARGQRERGEKRGMTRAARRRQEGSTRAARGRAAHLNRVRRLGDSEGVVERCACGKAGVMRAEALDRAVEDVAGRARLIMARDHHNGAIKDACQRSTGSSRWLGDGEDVGSAWAVQGTHRHGWHRWRPVGRRRAGQGSPSPRE